MNILHSVEFYSPSIGGAQEVVRQISERLVGRGHHVTVATTRLDERVAGNINGVHIEEFDISGNAVRGFQGETKRYQEFLCESNFDVIMNYAAQEWTTDLAFPVLDKIRSVKVFVPCGFSSLYKQAFANYFAEMPSNMKKYDHLVFHAGDYRDINFARQHGIENCTVIPNGAAEDEFERIDPTFRERYGIPKSVPMILTVGNHTRLKGHRLAIETLRRLKTRRVVLVIIGNILDDKNCFEDCQRRARRVNWMGLGQKRVFLLNPPRHDVVAAYHAADLFLFASNIEYSPIVLYETLAARTPFVSLACGNAAEIVEWTGGGLIAPTRELKEGFVDGDSESMAKIVDGLLKTSDKRISLAEAGHKAWRSRFTWENLTLDYEDLYNHLLERRAK